MFNLCEWAIRSAERHMSSRSFRALHHPEQALRVAQSEILATALARTVTTHTNHRKTNRGLQLYKQRIRLLIEVLA